VREMVRLIKEAGGRPFLTDANTLYGGRRRQVRQVERRKRPVGPGICRAERPGQPMLRAEDHKLAPRSALVGVRVRVRPLLAEVDLDLVVAAVVHQGDGATGLAGLLQVNPVEHYAGH
jgi:hypothetical protein